MSQPGLETAEGLKIGTLVETGVVDLSLVDTFTDRITESFDRGWAIGSVYQGTRVPYLGILRTVGQEEYDKLTNLDEVRPAEVIAYDIAGSGVSSFLIDNASRNGSTLPKSYSFSGQRIGATGLLNLVRMSALDLPNWRVNSSDKFARNAARTECEQVIQASMLGE